MDSKTTHERKGIQKEKMINQDGYLVNEEMEDDVEEEGGDGGYVDDEKRKVVYGKQGGNGGSSGGGGVSPPCCQVDRCEADLSEAKRYHKRHKVCELHAKAPAVVVGGLRQRFCQQCSRFHELSEFDESKRSCRKRLAGHNERRRKTSAEPCGESSGRKSLSGQMKETQWRLQSEERSKFQINLQGNTRSQFR